jgi:NifU-like protein involved in Fe-S cluster formation
MTAPSTRTDAASAILSACITHQTRADLRSELATGRTAAQVEVLLEQFDAMVRTGDC